MFSRRAIFPASSFAAFGARASRATLTSRAAAELGLPRSDDPAALDLYRSCLSADGGKRLAFLGDAVLYIVATRALFEDGPGERALSAGEMHRARLPVIGNKHLAERGRAFGVDDMVTDGRVADAVEALVGASFAVGGMEAASAWVHRRILPAEFPLLELR